MLKTSLRLATCVVFVGMAIVPIYAGEVVIHESFEDELADWTTYREGDGASLLSRTDEVARTGDYSLRVETKGLSPLEGAKKLFSGLEPNRRYTVTVRARGEGTVMLCAPHAGVWVYGEHVPLTASWQDLRISMYVTGNAVNANILTIGDAQQVVFFLDDLEIVKEPVREGLDVDVSPVKLEAQDYPANAQIRHSDATSGGAYSEGWPNITLGKKFPFPRTTKPVFIYLKAAIDENNANNTFAVNNLLPFSQRGERRTVLQLPAANEWVWVKAGPFAPGEIISEFSVEYSGPDRVRGRLDCLVISTDEHLVEAELDAAPALYPNRPLVTAGKTTAPPVIDGSLEDSAWQEAIALGGFSLLRTAASAEAATVARLTYDDENLYIAFFCEEPILDILAQRTHEFRARVEDKETGKAWWDEHVFIMISPPDSDNYYDFFINAHGVVEEGVCQKPDMWPSRDDSWDSQARAAGSIEDGFWRLEVAIPFASMGRQAPQPGETWELALGRNAIARSETSSWNLFGAGFHDPVEMGHLVFSRQVPGLQLNIPQRYDAGVNRFDVEIIPAAAQPAEIYLVSSVRSADTVAQRHSLVELDGDPVAAVQEVELADVGEMSMALGALDALSLQPLYLSPWRSSTVASQAAILHVFADSAYRVFLNGGPVASGGGNAVDEVSIFLQKGQNVITVEAEAGTAALRLEVPGLDSDTVRWRLGEPGAQSRAVETDDRTWDIAPEAGRHDEVGTVFGRPGAPAVLRHTLLWEETRIWPTQEPAFHIARGTNQFMHVTMLGLPGKLQEDWTLHFAVPREFEILGASGYYGVNKFNMQPVEEIELDGRTMNSITVRADVPVPTNRHTILSRVILLVRYNEEFGGEIADDAKFVYWTKANDGTMTEARQEKPIILLPPVNGRQPQELPFLMWHGFLSQLDEKQLYHPILETLQATGINEVCRGGIDLSSISLQYGVKNGFYVSGSLENETRDYVQENPEASLIKMDGTPHGSRMCTSQMLEDKWHVVEESVKALLERTGAHVLDYDYEATALGDGSHSCYCPRCLENFREHAQIPANITLDGTIVNREYDTQWVDFMAWRVANIFKKLRESVHTVAPGTKFFIYSGYHRPEQARQYGVDWEYVGKLQAADAAGMGYGRPIPAITESIRVLDGIPVMFGILIRPYNMDETWALNPLTKALVLRRALDATGGVLIYSLGGMEGRGWHAMADASRVIAEFEELFLHGEMTAIEGLNDANVQVVSSGGKTLVVVMNYSNRSSSLQIPLPADQGEGYEFYSGERVTPGQVVSIELEPGDARVYVFGNN